MASLLPGITRKAFEKHGFAAASLITDWAAIVGAEMARLTRPERLKWPRAVEKYSDTDDEQRGRPGATLTLRVDPAAALDVQYQRAQIIERINAHFGYRAVAEIKLVQAGADDEVGEPMRMRGTDGPARSAVSDATAPGAKQSATSRSVVEPANLSAVEDEGLRAALARLAASLAERSSG